MRPAFPPRGFFGLPGGFFALALIMVVFGYFTFHR
jgi:uncharacterized membrane protein